MSAGAHPGVHLVILGATGSIGRQALEVLPCLPQVQLVGLAARADVVTLLDQAAGAGVRPSHCTTPARPTRRLPGPTSGSPVRRATRCACSPATPASSELIHDAADAARAAGAQLTVLNGIVGAAGLRATLAALECGATLALANKESMVAGGPFVVAAARESGARVVPVDSEHSALFQCLEAGSGARDARRASAGPTSRSSSSRGRAAPSARPPRRTWPR